MLIVVWVATPLQRQRAPAYCRDVTDTVNHSREEVTGDEKWRDTAILRSKVDHVWQVNRHLRRSYNANFKIMEINAAGAPNNCQPAKKYGVMECNVRRWWVQKDRLKTLTVREKVIAVL